MSSIAFFAVCYVPCLLVALFTREDVAYRTNWHGGRVKIREWGHASPDYYLIVGALIDLALTVAFTVFTRIG